MTTPSLLPDILARIAADYPADRRDATTEALLALSEVTREPARVARCVLLVANGDPGKFKQMINLARTDYRDAIMAAEYDHTNRRLRDLSGPFGEGEPS